MRAAILRLVTIHQTATAEVTPRSVAQKGARSSFARRRASFAFLCKHHWPTLFGRRLSSRMRRLITVRYTNRPILLSELDWPLVEPASPLSPEEDPYTGAGSTSGPPAGDGVFSAGTLDVAEPDASGSLDTLAQRLDGSVTGERAEGRTGSPIRVSADQPRNTRSAA